MFGTLAVLAVCIGLWLLFPKGFKYLVGMMVGTFGALFLWGLFIVVWGIDHFSDPDCVPRALFWWSLCGSLIAGNGLGILIAAKG